MLPGTGVPGYSHSPFGLHLASVTWSALCRAVWYRSSFGLYPARRSLVRAAELAELFERSCFLSLFPLAVRVLVGRGSGLMPGFFWAMRLSPALWDAETK